LIYHISRTDWLRGVDEWIESFDRALLRSDHDHCRLLLQVRGDLRLESHYWLGRVTTPEGDYFADMARYTEALQLYTEAIAAYDRALERSPYDFPALMYKGWTLSRLGQLQMRLANQDAESSFRRALAVFDEALRHDTDHVYALHNKGLVLRNLGELLSFSEPERASQAFLQSVEYVDRSIARSLLHLVGAFTTKGGALHLRAQAVLARADVDLAIALLTEAALSFDQAIKVCEEQMSPHDRMVGVCANAVRRKSESFQAIGQIRLEAMRLDEAAIAFEAALGLSTQALRVMPKNAPTLANRAAALLGLARLDRARMRFDQADEHVVSAIVTVDEALRDIPGHLGALELRGLALEIRGELEDVRSRDEMIASLHEAEEAFAAVLATSPTRRAAVEGRRRVRDRLERLTG